VTRGCGPHEDPFADTVVTAVGALVELVDAWRRRSPVDPMLGDALLMLRGAADHLNSTLRAVSTVDGSGWCRSG
jgi:hypothetical protein